MALPLWNSKTARATQLCLHPNDGVPLGICGSGYSSNINISGNLRNKWSADSMAPSIMTSAGAATAVTPGHHDEATAAAASASATASPSTTTSASGTSITINNLQPGSAFIIKFKKHNDNEDPDVQMGNTNDS